MNDKELLNSLANDLRDAPARCVIYLEGKTDVDIFFALLGHTRPSGDLHQGVLIRGLQEGDGSGSIAVQRRVELGATFGASARILGFLDGDGAALNPLSGQFDAPFAGPLFSWKAYCIENLLPKAGWPPTWGTVPNWATEIRNYSPYVGLNRVHRNFAQILARLNIARFTNPIAGQALLREAEVSRELQQGKDEIMQRDVQQEFRNEVTSFKAALRQGLDHAHCLFNGKWLLSHLAVTRTRKSAEDCRSAWVAHAAAVGGLNEVKDWWTRIIGKAP